MYRNGFVSGIIAAVLIFTAPVLGTDHVYDGHFWIKSSADTKDLFLDGMMGGIVLGQDRLARYALTNKNFTPDCHRLVVSVANTLERQVARWDRQRLREAVDTFYDEPTRRDLQVRWAIMAVMLENKGAASEAFEPHFKPSKQTSP